MILPEHIRKALRDLRYEVETFHQTPVVLVMIETVERLLAGLAEDHPGLSHFPGCWKTMGHRSCAVKMLEEVWRALETKDDSAAIDQVHQVFSSRLERHPYA